jgi:hypothetical protein
MRIPRSRPLSVALLLSLCLALVLTLSGTSTVSAASKRLTNGCAVGPRGIPSCGAYVGAAYGGNSPVVGWERSMGKRLGVHRTYWGGRDIVSAVRQARADAAHKRIAWMSFKPPYSWKAMASGAGDAWARSLARRLKTVRGPVWVAVHHEPEGDGDIQLWKRMQARLAPIFRKIAPNVAYSIILMGYHEFHGAAKYRMSAIWPNTKIDIAGFDIYETSGAKSSDWKMFNTNYFIPIQRWARAKHVRWGLAETGYSDPAARANTAWIPRVYNAMRAHGGIAFSYFNTNLNSTANWRLSMPSKQAAFTRVLRNAPRLR